MFIPMVSVSSFNQFKFKYFHSRTRKVARGLSGYCSRSVSVWSQLKISSMLKALLSLSSVGEILTRSPVNHLSQYINMLLWKHCRLISRTAFQNSALVNGIGYFNCSDAEPGSSCTTQHVPLTLDLTAGGKARIRLIGAGSHAMFRFSADNHPLNVTEADSIGVTFPQTVHRVPFRKPYAWVPFTISYLKSKAWRVDFSFILRQRRKIQRHPRSSQRSSWQ